MGGKMPLWEKLFILPANIRGGALRDLKSGLERFSLNQLLLLNSLYSLTRDAGGGVPLKALATKLEVTPATASEMVETLVRRGILERRHSEVDRRAVENEQVVRYRLLAAGSHALDAPVDDAPLLVLGKNLASIMTIKSTNAIIQVAEHKP